MSDSTSENTRPEICYTLFVCVGICSRGKSETAPSPSLYIRKLSISLHGFNRSRSLEADFTARCEIRRRAAILQLKAARKKKKKVCF